MARTGYGDRLAGGRAGTAAQFGGRISTPQIKWDWMWMKPRKFKEVYGITKTQYEKAALQAAQNVALAEEKKLKRRKK